jgi:hypothetical protein
LRRVESKQLARICVAGLKQESTARLIVRWPELGDAIMQATLSKLDRVVGLLAEEVGTQDIVREARLCFRALDKREALRARQQISQREWRVLGGAGKLPKVEAQSHERSNRQTVLDGKRLLAESVEPHGDKAVRVCRVSNDFARLPCLE